MNLAQGAHSSASRRKKVARSLGRLERRGAVRFERLTTVSELESVIDEIGVQYDLRQGAANDYMHFGTDPLRKQFLLALMRTPGLLHATVLRHDGALVAANLGLSGKGTAYLGIIAHAAAYAKESPGKLQLVLLGDHLTETGYRTLDLTPGVDAYKPAFANDAADVYCLTVFSTALGRQLAVAQHRIVSWAKQGLRAVGVDPEMLKTQAKQARRAGLRRVLATAWQAVSRQILAREEVRLYAVSAAHVRTYTDAPVVRRDALEDLLAYEQVHGLSTRQDFLARAVSRLQNGHHPYTRVEHGRLVHCGWMAENQERAVLSEVGQSPELPPRSAILYDYHTHPTARGRGLYQAALRQMLQETAARGATDWIFIWVQARNTVSRHVIEKNGFEYRGSVFQHVNLGRVRHWSTFDDNAEQAETRLPVTTSIRESTL